MLRQTLAALCLSLLLVCSKSMARDRLLLDGHWTFRLGDPADLNAAEFAYPEVVDLAKGNLDDAIVEQRLAKSRKDPVATNLGGTVSFVQPGFDDSDWRKLNLPHDWVVELPFNKDADCFHGFKDITATKNNIGWYRKTFDLSPDDKNKSLSIEFDGVYRNSLVWLNGHCLGRNVSGYSSFQYEINTVANFGGKNELVVRVDASRMEGWFYEGAGIYRHVWLVKTAPVHVAHWGTFVVSTPSADYQSAAVMVQTTLRNDSDTDAVIDLQSSVRPFTTDLASTQPADASAVAVSAVTTTAISIPAGQTVVVSQQCKLDHPRLWSDIDPNLYVMHTQVVRAGNTVDEVDTRFGVRRVIFDVKTGMYLNGRHVFIKGTSNHQDHAGVGLAMPDRLQVYRLEQLKKFGCNGLRTTHNPPAPELLDAADEMGFLVMDEHRESGQTPEILGQLRRLILRDRNHPSIVLWSIGNEENELEGNDDVGETVARVMMASLRQLDSTRPITAAINKNWGKGFSRALDVEGFNYALNTSTGRYHLLHPRQPLIASEEGSTTSTRGVYQNDPKACYVAAYDTEAPDWATLAEKWWNKYKTQPFMAGAFVWTGFDYRGEPTPYQHWPCISSHFGMLDTCGFPKDMAFYYQSVWTDTPMVHLLPHWNWAGKEGQDINVWAYSNCDELELFVNEQSQGRQAFPAGKHLSWNIKYQPGSIKAVGYKGGKAVATDVVETTGAAAKIVLTPDRRVLNSDGEDIAIISVAITDDHDRVMPTAGNMVNFAVEGATIIGVGNGDPSCHESDKDPRRSAFNGLCQVIVQTTTTAGPVKFTATADGLPPATLTLEGQAKPTRLNN